MEEGANIMFRINKATIFLFTLSVVLLMVACGGKQQAADAPSNNNGSENKADVADEIVLKVADSFPTSHNLSLDGAVYWMEKVKELTDGKVKFEYYPSEQLGKARDLINTVKNKVADVAYVGIGYVPDKLPLSGVGELPGAAGSSVEASEAYWQVVQEVLLEEDFLKQGIRPMFAIIMPPYHIMTTEKPIKTIDDFQGVKVRSGGPAQSIALQELGAAPVAISAAEMYTALERNTIDGTILATSSIKPYQIDTLVKYVTENSNFGGFAVTYCINEEIWQSLPQDVQEAMIIAGEETNKHLSSTLDALVAIDREEMIKKGIEYINMDAENLEKFNQTIELVWEQWAEELDARNLPATMVKEAFKKALSK